MRTVAITLLVGWALSDDVEMKSGGEVCTACQAGEKLLQERAKHQIFSEEWTEDAEGISRKPGTEVRIRPLENVKKCLTAEKREKGQVLDFISCNEDPHMMTQLFKYDATTKQIKLFGTEICLNIVGGKIEAKTKVETWECTKEGDKDYDNDRFLFEDGRYKVAKDPRLCAGTWNTARLKLLKCKDFAETTKMLVSGAGELRPSPEAALIRPLQNVSLCVDVHGKKFEKGTKLNLWKCKEGLEKINQVFQYVKIGKRFQIKVAGSMHDLCLNIFKGEMKEGTAVKLWTCEKEKKDNDKWLLQNNQIIVDAKKKFCLGVKDGEFQAGKKLKLVKCDNMNSWQVTGEKEMDCPWKKPNDERVPTCGDGSLSYNCTLNGKGQRRQCPGKTIWKKMCNVAWEDVISDAAKPNKDFWCDDDCADHGGERPC